MKQRTKFSRISLGTFVVSLCPIAALLGIVICGIAQGARLPFGVAVVDAGVYVVGFLITALIGHVVAMAILPPARSKLFTGREWSLSVVCGAAVSVAAPLAETTEDVLGRFFGHH